GEARRSSVQWRPHVGRASGDDSDNSPRRYDRKLTAAGEQYASAQFPVLGWNSWRAGPHCTRRLEPLQHEKMGKNRLSNPLHENSRANQNSWNLRLSVHYWFHFRIGV